MRIIEKSDKLKQGVIMTKKVFPLFVLSLFLVFSENLFSQTEKTSASIANRRTAIRYLRLAKQNVSQKNWTEAASYADLGLAYDDTVSDLWYIKAVSKIQGGEKKSEVLPLVKHSLGIDYPYGDWVDYNKDGARILYADILCATRKYAEAAAVLDEKPFIYSADAEYIRAKALYSTRTEDSIENARLKIDAARRVYPRDSRFPYLFYSFEGAFLLENALETKDEEGNLSAEYSIDPLTQKIADSFILTLSNYTKANPELELLASVFVSDADKKTKLIKSFNEKKNKSVLYPLFALKASLIEEKEALEYFYGFADEEVNLSALKQMIKNLKTDEAKKSLCDYLSSYSGKITADTDGDLFPNMTVTYENGRIKKITYDKDNDDTYDFESTLEENTVQTLSLLEPELELKYSNWPYLQEISYNLEPETAKNGTRVSYELIANTLEWCPFTIESEETAKEFLDLDFALPVLNDTQEFTFTSKAVLDAGLTFEMPSNEKKDAHISISLLNGFPQQATYTAEGMTYALTNFENGLPVTRLVDTDGDGIFETTEEYGYSAENGRNFISKDDEMQVITNLFGLPDTGTGIYLKSIKIDKDGDTIPDFIEEYTSFNGKISSWDSDRDGRWDTRYVRLPLTDGKLHEQAMFYNVISGTVVTVESEDGIPVSVKSGEETLKVVKGTSEGFFWIDEALSYSFEEKVMEKINQLEEQSVCIIVENENQRVLAVKITGRIFAMKVPENL